MCWLITPCATNQEQELVYEVVTQCFTPVPWTKAQFSAEQTLAYSQTLVAKKGEQPIGFLLYHELGDQIEILLIGVLPAYRTKKIGTKLMAYLVQSTPLISEYFLEVRASNQAAQQFYQTIGFEHYHTRKAYYQHPQEDAYLLKKESRNVQ